LKTVADLIKELSEVDPSFPVFLSSDEEGNGYSQLYYIEPSMTVDYGGEIEVWNKEDVESGEHGEDETYKINAVILWP
jgi:hypothetical protein